ncbi:hypothetical protein [Saccharopolyspora aridisoli]|uniref:hypothetical protein n=1 Tax=Saccharopolyspora aridisoli TaxID=2530385 RepID=UPI0014045234|nr:hypothetical protein [Saccharopolyspora aridisoli]
MAVARSGDARRGGEVEHGSWGESAVLTAVTRTAAALAASSPAASASVIVGVH